MALDGIFLYHLKNEIASFAVGSRVDKIHQPSKEEIIITLRSKDGAKKLLLSSRADSARIHFTDFAPENPAKPPMFTMMLRKRLLGARLDSISQVSLERVLKLGFVGTDDLGDKTQYYLIIEIMSRYSNIILTDKDNVIIDCVRRIGAAQSSVREILPGKPYVSPPPQDKLNIFECYINEIRQKICSSGKALSKAAQDVLMGTSPIICREFENGLTLEQFLNYAKNPVPTVVFIDQPKDFAFLPINQYGNLAKSMEFSSFSELLDYFFYERVRLARIKGRSSELFKTLTTLVERSARKAENRKAELIECKDKEKYRVFADLIMANQYKLQKGSPYYDLEDFYNNMQNVRVPADVSLSPSANAQKYYKEYRKKQVAEQKLVGFIQDAENEAAYLDTVLDSLTRAETDVEITAIKDELVAGGYLKRRGTRKKEKAPSPSEYRTSDGYKILVGKNNIMNDKLTLKTAKGDDLWFHTKDTPGCHVILCTDSGLTTENAIHTAAMLAAYNSKARASSNVPVDYAFARFVKKPSGAKPGRVIYTDYKTEFVTPLQEEIERLEKIG